MGKNIFVGACDCGFICYLCGLTTYSLMEKTIEEIVLAECARLCPEKAKTAALVEALEEIDSVPTKMQETIDIYKESGYQLKTDSELIAKIAEFGFGELEFHTADIERLVTQSGIAFNALEAHKKGGNEA